VTPKIIAPFSDFTFIFFSCRRFLVHISHASNPAVSMVSAWGGQV
jgi:hypothetical protein